MIYLRLFWEFFKIGVFAVGGGLATLPFLQDLSARTGWFISVVCSPVTSFRKRPNGSLFQLEVFRLKLHDLPSPKENRSLHYSETIYSPGYNSISYFASVMSSRRR